MKSYNRKFIVLLLIASMLLGLCSCGGVEEKNQTERIGVIKDSVAIPAVEKSYPDSEMVEFIEDSDMPVALDEGKIDAYIGDEPVARKHCKDNPSHTITDKLDAVGFGFAFPFSNEKLRDEMNEYLSKLENSGELEAMKSIWMGDVDDLKQVDMSGLDGHNGEITMAISPTFGDSPFVYKKDDVYLGYEIDLAVSFCREYGYSINFVESDFIKMIDDVAAGEYDMAATSITITDERSEKMLFSDPDYQSYMVKVETKSEDDDTILSINDLDGKDVGIMTGSVMNELVGKYLPNSNYVYYTSNDELAIALDNDEIVAYMADEPVIRFEKLQYPDQQLLTMLTRTPMGFAFSKDSNDGLALQAMFNEFLREAESDGTLAEIDSIWFDRSNEKQPIDISSLPATRGTLTLGVSTETGAPFEYKDEKGYYGFDVDLAARFCRRYGYGLVIVDYSFTDLLDNVASGKCDFGASAFAITETRKKKVLFSDSYYDGGVAVAIKNPHYGHSDGKILSTDDLAGQKLAIQSGTAYDLICAKLLPDSPQDYYSSSSDMAMALETDKVAAYAIDEPVARLLTNEYPTHRILATMTNEEYAFVLPKQNKDSKKIQSQMNRYLKRAKEDGTLEKIDSVWFGDKESDKVVDYDSLPNINGKLTMATTTAVGPPFIYVKDGKYVGYSVDVAAHFCKEYGYALKVVDYDVSGLFSCLGSGKCDFGGACISITEERKETLLFSEPDYYGGIVVVIKDEEAAAENTTFIQSVANSFYRTFITENRWKLFLGGLGNSMFIILLSAIFGLVLGFLLYLIYWKNNRFICRTLDTIYNVLAKLPVVVILMIIYYIIFGKHDVSGVWVSIIGFTILFSGTVLGLLKIGVSAVSPTQREAAIALGYSETATLFRFILPQASVQFLPGLKSALVSLIKDTAIVGYIAVQDLTKISDIVRSRTFEAFFPLIATAMIYFAVAWLLTTIVNRIEIDISKDKRKVSILKGVKTR